MKLSEQIKKIAEEKKIEPKDLCDQVGVSLPTWYNFLKKPRITLETLEKFAKALGKKLVLIDEE